jgi:hypothetical protein
MFPFGMYLGWVSPSREQFHVPLWNVFRLGEPQSWFGRCQIEKNFMFPFGMYLGWVSLKASLDAVK